MDWAVIPRNFSFLLGGLLVSFKLAGLTLALSLPLGTMIALGRLSSRKWIYYPVSAFVNVLRANPLILIVFWFYFLVPIIIGRPIGDFGSVLIAFIIFYAAYFAEIVRSGIQSVGKGQIMAAYSTGLTYFQTMRYIILPPALRRMVPLLMTQTIILFQGTTVAFIIGLKEFLHRISLVTERELRSFELYIFAALVYLVICYFGSLLSRRLEVKQ
ncbi:MAG: amino acid ABC transporter permease [Planctomycetota bacterium]|jgi:glutamate/aspartate transport system permease protein